MANHTAHRDRIKAKAELYTFLHSATDDLLNLPGNKRQLSKELIHYGVQFLFPAYKTCDEIVTECLELCRLFHCFPPDDVRSLVAQAMVDKAFSRIPPEER